MLDRLQILADRVAALEEQNRRLEIENAFLRRKRFPASHTVTQGEALCFCLGCALSGVRE